MEINLRGHHISMLAGSYFKNKGVDVDSWFISDCNKWRDIILNNDIFIKVFGGIDFICEGCEKIGFFTHKLSRCGYEGCEDIWAREAYGLEIGQLGTVHQFVKRFEEFYKKTGATSPRELFLGFKPGGRYSFKENRFLDFRKDDGIRRYTELVNNITQGVPFS